MTTNPEVLRLAREVARPFLRRQFSDFDEKNLQAGYLDRSSIVQSAIAAIEKTTELAALWLKLTEPATQDWGSDVLIEQIHLRAMYLSNYDHLRQSEKDNSDAD